MLCQGCSLPASLPALATTCTGGCSKLKSPFEIFAPLWSRLGRVGLREFQREQEMLPVWDLTAAGRSPHTTACARENQYGSIPHLTVCPGFPGLPSSPFAPARP